MLDRYVVPLIKKPVDALARQLHRLGRTADQMTVWSFVTGLVAMIAIARREFEWGIVFILISRLGDALDGALARLSEPTDAGGFLDITLDFLFYAGIPLAFAIASPTVNALPAAVLLAAFIGTGTSFLAFATLAAKRGITSLEHPNKSLYFLGGLTEATETLIFFIAMCLWPQWFPQIAYVFAALCSITTITRVAGGYQTLKNSEK